jgi:hypothetical protein
MLPHDQTMIIAAAEPTCVRDGRAPATRAVQVQLLAPVVEAVVGRAARPPAGPLPPASRAALAAVVDVGSAGAARGWRTAALAALAEVAHPSSDAARAQQQEPGTDQAGAKVRQEATRAPAPPAATSRDNAVVVACAAGGVR